MPRVVNRLNALFVQRISEPGRYHDGLGLYLAVAHSTSKSWVFRYKTCGRRKEMGLGSALLLNLSEARLRVIDLRRGLLDGKDPLEERAAARRAQRARTIDHITFDQCALAYINGHGDKWTNGKHREQWVQTLKTYASPFFGDLPVQKVDTALVIRALEPIWKEKTETASRVRGRIESVLNYATAREWRAGENPARWRGHLDQLLPKPREITKVEHHAALPYQEINAFITSLRTQDGIAPLALEFLILTAGRTGEVLGANWSEINLVEKVWTVPGKRMKHGREHKVPLTLRALEILGRLNALRVNDMVFPGQGARKPLSNTSLLQVIKTRMNLQITSHGFRSTFRDWAAECTNFPNHVIEMALAHTIESKVEAAYRRGDLLLKRRKVMESWAMFCDRTVEAKIHELESRLA